MTKKTFISTILLFVFSFVLVHDIIPHHHYDEISEINNHPHKHHHNKKGQDHHNEKDEPIGLFSHLTHSPTGFRISNSHSFQKIQYANPFFLITDLAFKPATIPIKRESPNYSNVTPLQLFCSAPSLRGPPA